MGGVCLDGGNYGKIAFQARPTHQNQATGRLRRENHYNGRRNLGMIAMNLEVIWEMSD